MTGRTLLLEALDSDIWGLSSYFLRISLHKEFFKLNLFGGTSYSSLFSHLAVKLNNVCFRIF